MESPIVSFNNYSFKYHSQKEETIRNINLDIYPGEKILIVGPSGSGKSTLGHCINGLIPFSYKGTQTGSLKIDGLETCDQDIFKLSQLVGTVLQDPDGQFVGLTVGEDIAFALENDRIGYDEMHKRVYEAAELVDMEKLLNSSPFELSGGQKQRTSLAGIMINDVKVLLFDEPLANLDPATGKTAIEIIDRIHSQTNKAIVIIEHRLEDVLHRSVDRIIVIKDGEITADMPPDKLLCTDILTSDGIREPLYITAMKYAGIKPAPEMLPSSVNTVDMSGVKEHVSKWLLNSPHKKPPDLLNPILSLENIRFSYDLRREIIKGISFNVYEGEMLAVVGRNGAGKSTLTKLLCGFEKPVGGTIRYKSKDIKEHSIAERSQYIGLVMQNPNQMISETMIAAEAGLGLKLRGFSEKETEERVRHALEICGLAPFRSWPISALSFGQKKRLTIASMLTLNPQILILDEPTAGQDYRHYTEIMNFLSELNKKGVTVILITHDMHLMLEYTPRSIVLSDGMLICDGAASEVLTNRDVIEQANLRETSLFTFADRAGLDNATEFVQRFIDYERWAREQ